MRESDTHNPYLEQLQSNFFNLLHGRDEKLTPPKRGFPHAKRLRNRQRNKVARKARLVNRGNI